MAGKAQKAEGSREAWVRFGGDGSPIHVLVDVAADGKTVTLDRDEFNAMAGRLGMAQTRRLPDEVEPVDTEALVGLQPIPQGNQPLGAPNRVEGDAPEDDGVMREGNDPADFTVEQVNTFLGSGIDDAERDRVLQLERDGQNRTTITGE
jgi:hypothetical protein